MPAPRHRHGHRKLQGRERILALAAAYGLCNILANFMSFTVVRSLMQAMGPRFNPPPATVFTLLSTANEVRYRSVRRDRWAAHRCRSPLHDIEFKQTISTQDATDA